MSIALPDVNVLVALAWPTHVHHRQARAWFDGVSPVGWATCPITQSGFIRVSSNRAAVDEAVSPQDAAIMLRRMVAWGRHVFWPDDLDLTATEAAPLALLTGHRQVTDAYLVGLARHHGGTLATFDRDVPDLLPVVSAERSVIELIQG